MAKNLIPISPAAHYMCGGIKVNLKGETGIKNLYAFGEVACTGVHGANRLASNSLLEALVFSDSILRLQKGKKTKYAPPHFKKARVTKNKISKWKVEKIKTRLRCVMWKNVGIIRSKKSLETARVEIIQLKKRTCALRGESAELLELKNMLTTAGLIVTAAMKRRKSLGCHYRI